jgi:hypothetical protein
VTVHAVRTVDRKLSVKTSIIGQTRLLKDLRAQLVSGHDLCDESREAVTKCMAIRIGCFHCMDLPHRSPQTGKYVPFISYAYLIV